MKTVYITSFIIFITTSVIFITTSVIFITQKWKTLQQFWKIAKRKGQNKKDKIDFIKKQEAKGLKPFKFDLGNTIIYAENGNRALLDYKRLQNESKIIRKNLKKAK